MKSILRNWRTSLIGGGVLTSGIVTFIQTGDFKQAIPSLLMGVLGLLCKDHNEK